MNQEGNIDLTDLVLIFNDASTFVTGYKVTDVNGDLITDLTDELIAFNNASLFVNKMTP